MDTENVDAFRERARNWLAANLRKTDPGAGPMSVPRIRELLALLYEGGFSGLTVPVEYGGQGLTDEHDKAFRQEATGYEMPLGVYVHVTLGMIVPTLLEHATDDFNREHLPRILKGEEIWFQMLSEPGGGSDLAGATTRAVRDGDQWILNGSKIWSTGADQSDYGMCLTRTNWDVPKHQGLSMFGVAMNTSGVKIEPIQTANGESHFCQEFLDDVAIPAGNLIGEDGQGWSVAQTLLFHERNATAGVERSDSAFSRSSISAARAGVEDLIALARARNRSADPATRQVLAQAFVTMTAQAHLNEHIQSGYRSGKLEGPWGSLAKLGSGLAGLEKAKAALRIAGPDAVADLAGPDGLGRVGNAWLVARSGCIAGGTDEIQRNIISERLLGLPREASVDRNVPFSQVARGSRDTTAG